MEINHIIEAMGHREAAIAKLLADREEIDNKLKLLDYAEASKAKAKPASVKRGRPPGSKNKPKPLIEGYPMTIAGAQQPIVAAMDKFDDASRAAMGWEK